MTGQILFLMIAFYVITKESNVGVIIFFVRLTVFVVVNLRGYSSWRQTATIPCINLSLLFPNLSTV